MSKEDDEKFENSKLSCMCEEAFFIESQNISAYIKQKVERYNLKSVLDCVRIEKAQNRCNITGKI